MKRMVAAVLAAGLLGQSAMAAEAVSTAVSAVSQDAQLETVTALVKMRLGIDDSYTSFYGQPQSDAEQTTWDLNWSKDTEQLEVSAKTDGTVLSYWRSSDAVSAPNSGIIPALSKHTQAEGLTAAQTFVNRLLGEGETVTLEGRRGGVQPLSTETSYGGTIYYKGVKTPDYVQVSVDMDELTVDNFYRNASQHLGGIPSQTPAVRAADAQSLLRGTMQLQPIYTTDFEQSEVAKLCYVPTDYAEYYVDAQTGKLVNLSELRRKLYPESAMGATSDSMAESAADAGLTETEQAGAALLAKAQSAEQLTASLQQISELGLSAFVLENSRYTVDPTDESVTCSLRFASKKTDDKRVKYATVDAKTGELQYLDTYAWSQQTAQEGGAVSAAEAAVMERFLQTVAPERFAQTAAAQNDTTDSLQASRTYQQRVNGYFCPEQSLSVSVDRKDKTISSYACSWRDDLQFAPVDTVISAAQAQTVYADSFRTTLQFQEIPVSAEQAPLEMDVMYRYRTAWTLAYVAEAAEPSCHGVDAVSGEPLFYHYADEDERQYADLDAAVYPEAAALAAYGVGYCGETYRPAEAVTQADLLSLVFSSYGRQLDPADEDQRAALYENAYAEGLLDRSEYAPDTALNRAQMVRLIVNAIGLRTAAEIRGIYRCSFTDQADIPADCYGHIAIAAGLGLIRGNENGAFEPFDTATRAQAAIVLYHYMNR